MKCIIHEYNLNAIKDEKDPKKKKIKEEIFKLSMSKVYGDKVLRINNTVVSKSMISECRRMKEIELKELPIYIAQRESQFGKTEIINPEFIKRGTTAYITGDLVYTIEMVVEKNVKF